MNLVKIAQVMNARSASVPKIWLGARVSNFPPQIPAIKLPKKLVKNQQPIINERNFLGASLDTSDNPIGERQSSAIVIIKYPTTSQRGETFVLSDKIPAYARRMYERAIKNNDVANFSTEVGSFDFFFKFSHSILTRGARVIIKKGFSDWKYSVGISYPKTFLLV